MPETTRPTPAAPEFVELVCADPVLLHAEFEAIVAANFPTPPSGERPPRVESGAPTRRPVGLARPGVNYRDAGGTAHLCGETRDRASGPICAAMRAPCEATSQENCLAVSVGPAVAVRRGRILRNKRLATRPVPTSHPEAGRKLWGLAVATETPAQRQSRRTQLSRGMGTVIRHRRTVPNGLSNNSSALGVCLRLDIMDFLEEIGNLVHQNVLVGRG